MESTTTHQKQTRRGRFSKLYGTKKKEPKAKRDDSRWFTIKEAMEAYKLKNHQITDRIRKNQIPEDQVQKIANPSGPGYLYLILGSAVREIKETSISHWHRTENIKEVVEHLERLPAAQELGNKDIREITGATRKIVNRWFLGQLKYKLEGWRIRKENAWRTTVKHLLEFLRLTYLTK